MRIAYTIENDRIELETLEIDKASEFVRVYNNCLPVISFFHMKGRIEDTTQSIFSAAPGKGIILSVQLLRQNSSFEFQSSHGLNINFSPSIESIQMMLTGIAFRHIYETPGIINRFDVFIPAGKINELFSKGMLDQLQQKKILNLNTAPHNFLGRVNDSLSQVLNELEKPVSKSLCTHIENFIQSVTMQAN